MTDFCDILRDQKEIHKKRKDMKRDIKEFLVKTTSTLYRVRILNDAIEIRGDEEIPQDKIDELCKKYNIRLTFFEKYIINNIDEPIHYLGGIGEYTLFCYHFRGVY